MKTSKKIISVIAALMLAASLAACDFEEGAETGSQPESSAAVSSQSDSEVSSEETDTADSDSDEQGSDSDKKSSDSDKKKDDSSKDSSSKKKESSSKAASSKAASSKAASSKAASSKAASSKAASSKSTSSKEEAAKNPVEKFEGTYTNGRAMMEVKAVGTRDADIYVSWSSSADTYSEWHMSGTMDPDVSVVKYTNCTRTDIQLSEDGTVVYEDDAYKNGSGRIVFLDSNQLSWEDDEENVADGVKFQLSTGSDSDTSSSNDSEYISKDEAIKNVKEQAGSSAEIVSAFKGYSPEGYEAWVITVVPEGKSEQVTYYTNKFFCYTFDNSDSDDNENDGYISRQEALANVKQMAGSGAEILDAYKGYTYDGVEAWIVTVAPVSASEDAENVVYYVGYQFCYTLDQ